MGKLSFATILVHDMQQALEFYSGLLGFAVLKQDHYPEFVVLGQDSHPIALHQVKDTKPAEESHVILGVAVDDLAKKLDELKAKGAQLLHQTPQKFFGGLYAGIHDPSGNMLELIEWNPEAREKYRVN